MNTTIGPELQATQAVVHKRLANETTQFLSAPCPRGSSYHSCHVGSLVKNFVRATSASCGQYSEGWEAGDTKLSAESLRREDAVGGAAAHTASAARAMGFVPRVAGNIGPDEAGRFVQERLAWQGIRPTYVRVRRGRTAESFVTLATDGHLIETSPGVGTLRPCIPLADLADGRFQFVTVSSLKPSWRHEVLRELAKGARACRRQCVIAVNLSGDWTLADFEILRAVAKKQTVFYQGNRFELRSIAHAMARAHGDGVLAPIRTIRQVCGTPIVGTCGSDGCYCLGGEPSCLHIHAVYVANPTTRVGLGDTHLATLAAMLALGFSWKVAAQAAAVAAAHAAMGRRLPGFGGPPDRVAHHLLAWAAQRKAARAESLAVA